MIENIGLMTNGQVAENIKWNVGRLESRKMIDISPRKTKGTVSERVMVFRITDTGRAALHAALVNMRLYGGVAVPSRSDKLEKRPLYTPPKAYYRNNGNTHIKSLGAFA